MSLSPKLTADAAAARFAELAPAYTRQEAVLEADRCLYCYDAPCVQACPTQIDVPSFIRKIAQNNPIGAARTILSANVLGASCARVCPTDVLCEGACVVLRREGNPVKIGRLQRYATDQAAVAGRRLLAPAATRSGRRVAVVGGGPAGLACAAELARLGHAVVIFEKRAHAGGLNTYGVAYYKMRPETSLAEVELVRSLGVEIRCGVEVGRQVSAVELERDFDAVFIGVGLGHSLRLGLPGEHLSGVMGALEFIEHLRTLPLHEVPVGQRVAVIGGGNTAMDAATQARRLGAEKSVVIYRRGEEAMRAYASEQELARGSGVEFWWHTVPLECIAGPNGTMAALKLARTAATPHGVQVLPHTEFREAFDMVLLAIGEERPGRWLKQALPRLEVRADGAVTCDPATGQTNLAHVFAGGDCANGGREVVHAVAEGKRAAQGIHAFLQQCKVTHG